MNESQRDANTEKEEKNDKAWKVLPEEILLKVNGENTKGGQIPEEVKEDHKKDR